MNEDEFDLKVVDNTKPSGDGKGGEGPTSDRCEIDGTSPVKAGKGEAPTLPAPETPEGSKNESLPERFIQFCRKVDDEQLISEVVSLFGAREPTACQKSAGVKHGIYSASEYNRAYESLAKKSGIRVRYERKDKEEQQDLAIPKLELG